MNGKKIVNFKIPMEDGDISLSLELISKFAKLIREQLSEEYIAIFSPFDMQIENSLRFPVVTLCGSTKFKEDFIRIQKELTLQGYIVISVGLFGHSGDNEVWLEDNNQMLDDMHKCKIDMADEIYVINKNGYIGESTKNEIEYAIKHGKKVNYME